MDVRVAFVMFLSTLLGTSWLTGMRKWSPRKIWLEISVFFFTTSTWLLWWCESHLCVRLRSYQDLSSLCCVWCIGRTTYTGLIGTRGNAVCSIFIFYALSAATATPRAFIFASYFAYTQNQHIHTHHFYGNVYEVVGVMLFSLGHCETGFGGTRDLVIFSFEIYIILNFLPHSL